MSSFYATRMQMQHQKDDRITGRQNYLIDKKLEEAIKIKVRNRISMELISHRDDPFGHDLSDAVLNEWTTAMEDFDSYWNRNKQNPWEFAQGLGVSKEEFIGLYHKAQEFIKELESVRKRRDPSRN